MFIIVGLGNPTKEYNGTRHNVGFDVIDAIADQYNISVTERKCRAFCGIGVIEGRKVILVKPQTYMNLSGESVRGFIDFYKIDVETELLVIYDDVSLDVGQLRIRKKGSAGGHNGIKSLIAHTKTQEFKRIRVGIDRHPKIPVVDYVLGKFTEDELALVNQAIDLSVKACEMALTESFNKVMTEYSK